MRILLLVLLALPLHAATYIVANLSDQSLDELPMHEQQRDVLKQIKDLEAAGYSGTAIFDVASEVCQEIQFQSKSDTPFRGRVIRPTDATRPCRTVVDPTKAKWMVDGWDAAVPPLANPGGTTITVCASGCTYTTPQAAWDAHTFGDVIELKAETFGTGTDTTKLTIDDDHDFVGNCPYYTIIEVENYSTNFTPGTRVTAADSTNMAKLVGGNEEYGQIIKFRPSYANINAMNTSTDTITSSAAHGFNVGDKITFLQLPNSPYSWPDVSATGLHRTRPYWIDTAPTTTTFTLTETPGGAKVDITAEPTGGYNSIAARRFDRPVSCVVVRGIEAYVATTEGDKQALVRLDEDNTPLVGAFSSHIVLQHLYLHGQPNEIGPHGGILANARYLSVRDSLITEVKRDSNFGETTCIGLRNVPGPAWIYNNGLNCASINYYVGGVTIETQYVDNGTLGGIVDRNNYAWKNDGWFTISFAGAPSGTCHPGGRWKDTTGAPDYYTCGGGGTWGSTDPNGDTYFDWQIKNLWETKNCDGCLSENFWAALSPYGDAGQAFWLNIKNGGTQQGWLNSEVTFYNFRSRYTAAGPGLRGDVLGGETFVGKRLGPTVAWNGLATEVDKDIYKYQNVSTTANRIGQFGSNDEGFELRHYTELGFAASANQRWHVFGPEQADPDRDTQWLSVKDSIIATQGVIADAKAVGCSSYTYGVAAGGTATWENNLLINSTALSMAACSTLYWTEAGVTDVGFADELSDWELTSAGTSGDYRAGGARDASDGKDVGVDTEVLFDGLGGSDPTAGLGSWSSQYGVAVTAIGTTTASVEFDRPASNTCDLTLYTDYARTAEHGDTNTAGEKLDSNRTVVSDHVTFTLGTNTALTTKTWYWFEIDCATDSVKMVGSLFTN